MTICPGFPRHVLLSVTVQPDLGDSSVYWPCMLPCVHRDSDWTAPCLGSPDVSTDAGILMGCQTSGNVGYAHMHRSLELLLVWKSLILLCARDWTLLGSFGWANCTCVIQLLLVHLKEMQDLKEELVCVCPSLVRP